MKLPPIVLRGPSGTSAWRQVTKSASFRPHSRLLHTARPCQSDVKSYISSSHSPQLNLSLEHHLLSHSHPDSTILFLYRNRPSIIIGRNQNPWLETNLSLLRDASSLGISEPVELVRRRSGGGTVFHDLGNVNWTVICPSADFTRDKHAEMVVRALRSLGVARARVNERHDIVLDQGTEPSPADPDDTHVTSFASKDVTPLKVSGSAYKLTRGRALHHAKGFMSARGVESVSSPVGNLELEVKDFMQAVQREFGRMYGSPTGMEVEDLEEGWADRNGVVEGIRELESPEWTFLQTPQFTFSSTALPGKGSNASAMLDPATASIDLTVRYGAITTAEILLRSTTGPTLAKGDSLTGRRVHEITDWQQALSAPADASFATSWEKTASWLSKILPSIA
ncbi:hypothetical protein B0A48_11292 [Cryoendolithus antarcticus]|uniref:Putative lipoate-protein ligase A n=1 Tax=Cryoendolithus antarcticus TaxID=1507870 RepID=A0A1V8SVI4_9PEZI|nr:hypothetical protein B0A48_11292 [Cryoendolithus antarcticus]